MIPVLRYVTLSGFLLLSALVEGFQGSPSVFRRHSTNNPRLAVDHYQITRCPSKTIRSTTVALSKNWDNLVDEDDGAPIPPDMKYIERNVRRQNQHFLDIRQVAGKELTNDVYIKEPNSQVFWFVGKISRVSDVSPDQAVARQWHLIEHHAGNLRPIELFPSRGSLEIWLAPGDSELDVAYNRPELVFRKMSREVEGASTLKNNLMGFQGEVYEQGEQGFRTWRNDDGTPANPEIQVPAASLPEDDEMGKLEKALETMDINDLYREQQRREGKSVED